MALRLRGPWLSLSQRSSEIPVALAVTDRLAGHCRSVSDQCSVLAQACSDYADRVEEQREAILDLVHDLVRDAVIIQGIGIVLGAVTAGTTAAAAAALNAAKIAAAAPRFLRIIETLRTLASTCAAPVRLAAASLRDVRGQLAVFRNARTTVASAYDAERPARVDRLRESSATRASSTPRGLRGLTKAEVEILEGLAGADRRGRRNRTWISFPHRAPDPCHGRVPTGKRADPMTDGPYAVNLAGTAAGEDPAT